MDDYIQFKMTSTGGDKGNSGGGCLSFFLACILVFGGIGYILSLFQ